MPVVIQEEMPQSNLISKEFLGKNCDKILFRRPRRQNGGQSVESKSKKNLLLLVHSRHRALRTFSADRQTDDAVSVADMVSTDIICTVL